ncbi:MAG: invasion associated locus B family protein [Methylococcaceae bacterium]|nr:invasion associated locus B family protein [Methylococcaceae bacterium]
MRSIFKLCVLFIVVFNSACAVTKETDSVSAPASKSTATAVLTDEIVFQDWRKKCQFVKNKGDVCFVYQNLTIKESGKSLLYASFTYTREEKKLVGSFRLPFGLLLPSGIAIQVDENKQVNFAVQTCLADGCYVYINIANDLLNELKNGEEAKVGFKTIEQKQLAVKLSLKGFAPAIESLQN